MSTYRGPVQHSSRYREQSLQCHHSHHLCGFFLWLQYIKYTEMMKPFYYQLMHIMLTNTELLKHSKITLQHVSVYVETIFRELQSVLG